MNILLLVTANLLIKPFYLFGIERKVQYLLGNTQYGHYYNIFNFTLILQFVNDFGLQNYTSRLISQHRSDASGLTSPLNGLKILLTLIYFALTLAAAWLWYGPSVDLSFVLHLAFNQMLISLIFFLRAQIAGLGLYRTDSLLSIMDRLLLILSLGLILYLPGLDSWLDLKTFVMVQTMSLAAVSIMCLIILAREGIRFLPLRPDPVAWKKAFEYCIPFAMIYLTNAMFTKADSVWLQKWLPDGAEEAGLYASC